MPYSSSRKNLYPEAEDQFYVVSSTSTLLLFNFQVRKIR